MSSLPPKISAGGATVDGDTVGPPPSSSKMMSWLVRNAGLDLPQTPWRRYGIALAAVTLALTFRWLLDPYLGNRANYGFFLIATAFVAWRCGTAPALFTVGCGAALGQFFFEEPRGSFQWPVQAGQISLMVSLLIGSATAAFCGSLRHTAMENSRLYRLARENDQRKDEFLAMLAHELRNPLTPLKNAVYLLDAMGPHEKQVEEMHRLIDSQVEHLTRLVDDLLDVSRITHGKIDLRLELVDIGRAVEDALNAVRMSLEERGHDLRITLPATKAYLRADRVRLTQVLVNLLNNAIKYTPPSGRIWFTAETEGKQLVLRVRDTGIGLTPDEAARIFNLFEQAGHSPEQTRGGLGIGLTLVRRLVEMHGGGVEGQSAGHGLGSEFTVRLPLAASPEEPARITSPAAAPARTVAPPARLKIVVVEDAAATAKSMATMLNLWQHETKTCSDGFAALETIRVFRPDVVLADIGLPQMSGYQLAQEIRRLPGLNDIVLIAISGYGQPADRERAHAAGFSQHLTKPINPVELERILDDLKPAYAKADARDS